MLKISILKVENPSCLWGRVVWGPGGNTESLEHYNSLWTQMNLFYHDLTQDHSRLRPTSIEEGQVYVVYWKVKKLWCRAVMESVIMDSVSCQACCLLVDHGERTMVSSDQIHVALPSFLQLPFWVRKFHLARVKPTTLWISVYEEKAELKPSAQWNSSATLYLHNLLIASTRTEAVLLEFESDSTSIDLYLTIGNVKICVNDDLVDKKFAYYISDSTDGSELHPGDWLPVMLSSNILTQTAYKSSNKQAVQSQQLCSEHAVTSQSSYLVEAADWQMVLPPSQQNTSLPALKRRRRFMSGFLSVPPNQGESETKPEDRLVSRDSQAMVSQNCEINDDGLKETAELSNTSPEPEQHETSISLNKSFESKPETWRTEEDWVCSSLLEWLNPEPLNPDPDAVTNIIPSDIGINGVLVHSAFPVETCNGLEDAPVTDLLRQMLQRKKYCTLFPADCYSWPAVARGNNTLIITCNADNPLSYLAPFLTHILQNSVFTSLSSSSGPIAVLLCSGWEKAQAIYDLLEEAKVSKSLHPVVVLLGVGKDEAKAVKIPQNCLLLVTTPFTLVRLLSHHCFLFLRMYHLVLDEANRLFELAPDQMDTILQHFQKVTFSEEKASYPKQLVAVAKSWTNHMEGLIASHMPYPYIIITVLEEAALYGNIQQVILMTLEMTKISVLLGALDFSPDVGQKTVIVTNSIQEADDVFKAVNNKSVFCLKTHEGLTDQFEFVIEQWRKDIGPSTHVILVTTSECLRCLGIRDATCLVHYGFPTSPKLFGSRLFCMSENFRNLSRQDPTVVARSVLLISERNVRHVFGVLRFLKRTSAPLPPELLSCAHEVHVSREHVKMDRPLCTYLKSFGFCRNSSVCPDRHTFSSLLDQSELPASGVIEVVPLHIKSASVFYGHVIRTDDSRLDMMTSEMAAFYAERKPGAEELLQGGLYAVQQDQVFHRVKILSLGDRADCLFFPVMVLFIDVGKEEEVKSHQILHLPDRFHSLPGQAVEMIVCRVKPADAETDWHPKVTRTISHKIRGLQHQARAVLSLGNTVFVDPMVRVTKVPGIKTLINECNVQSEILNTGMGVRNPDHLDLLKALCQEGLSNSNPETGQTVSISEGGQCCLTSVPPVSLSPQENGVPEGGNHSNEEQVIKTCEAKCNNATKSFHPQVVWYQTSKSVIITVKLRNPESQCCDFYPERVIYSGRVNGRSYRVDLELHQKIAADICLWEMKSNEPVLILMKMQQGFWERLIRNKNIFVSYNMEHMDEDKENVPNGPRFAEDMGEDNCYVDSQSDEESD